MHKDKLSYLFESMIKGDGHSCRTHTGFISLSKKLVRDFAELCLCLGYTFSINQKNPEDVVIKEKFIPKENQSKCWFVRVNKPKKFIQLRNCQGKQKSRKQDITKQPYKGKVYCVTVEDNNNLYVGEEGHFVFSGNCMPEQLGIKSERGYLYPCRDSIWTDNSGYRKKGLIPDIVNKMCEAYSDIKNKDTSKSELALRWAQAHDWSKVTLQWIELFDEVLKEKEKINQIGVEVI
jgi:hypothetical protein